MLKSGSKNNLVIVSEIATGSSYTQSVSIELTSCYVSAYNYVFIRSEVRSFKFKIWCCLCKVNVI